MASLSKTQAPGIHDEMDDLMTVLKKGSK